MTMAALAHSYFDEDIAKVLIHASIIKGRSLGGMKFHQSCADQVAVAFPLPSLAESIHLGSIRTGGNGNGCVTSLPSVW